MAERNLISDDATAIKSSSNRKKQSDGDVSVTILELTPDFTKSPEHWSHMIEPNLYVALHVEASTVTYKKGKGPDFNLKEGVASLQMQAKE